MKKSVQPTVKYSTPRLTQYGKLDTLTSGGKFIGMLDGGYAPFTPVFS